MHQIHYYFNQLNNYNITEAHYNTKLHLQLKKGPPNLKNWSWAVWLPVQSQENGKANETSCEDIRVRWRQLRCNRWQWFKHFFCACLLETLSWSPYKGIPRWEVLDVRGLCHLKLPVNSEILRISGRLKHQCLSYQVK